jgi:ribosomal protein S4
MTKRIQRKYKLLRFYQEDLWGRLGISHTIKNVKINRLLREIQLEKTFFRREIQEESSRLKKKFGVLDMKTMQSLRGAARNIAWKNFKRYKLALADFMEDLRVNRIRPDFNFRTDIGKPKRKTRFLSNFGRRMKLRQKLRRFTTAAMGVRQFRNYLRKARKHVTLILFFFRLFETRLDTLVFRLNLALTSGEARQLVNHGNFIINGREIIFPTHSIDVYDVMSVKDKQKFFDRALTYFQNQMIISSIPSYLEVNFRIMSAVLFINPLPNKVSYQSPEKFDFKLLASSGPKFNH